MMKNMVIKIKKVWNRELEGQIIYQRNISQKL